MSREEMKELHEFFDDVRMMLLHGGRQVRASQDAVAAFQYRLQVDKEFRDRILTWLDLQRIPKERKSSLLRSLEEM